MKTICILFVLLMGFNSMAQNTFIAHRGASFLAPENTVAAAKLAWELGADAVEVDVHLSKDNRVMVIHDKDTKRTCSEKTNLTIAKTPSILLRDLDAGSWKDDAFKGEKIPFLSEIIETVPPGKNLVIEIKDNNPDIISALEKCIDKTKKIDQVVFISFGWKTILAAHKAFPGNKCYWLSALKPGLKKRMEQAAKEKLTGINLKHSIINEEIMALANELNLEVLSWTVDEPEEAQRLSDIGVTAITTNRPKWLKEQMAQ